MKWLPLVFALLCGTAFSQTIYYVDPPFTGGSNNGSPANPWTSVASGWATINTALASGPVIVYFSASQGQTTQIDTTSRTNTSTNALTLNGTEKVNANDGTNNNVTNWVAGVPLTPCSGQDCTQTAAWIGHQYTITYTGAGGAITSPNAVNSCQGYVNLRGFHLKGQGKILLWTYAHDTTVEYNELEATTGSSIGPGIYIGPGQNGPCNASTSNVGGPDNVTYQYNYTHKTYGECLYVGAETSDPPGYGSSEYTSNGMTCTSNCNTGAHYRILYNTNHDCAFWGGQGDGTDIKDGHADLWFIGNTNRPSIDSPAGQGGAMGVVAESGALFIGNYLQDDGNDLCNGIRMANSWYNFAGRQDLTVIANNAVTGFKSGACNNYGIVFTAPDLGGSLAYWTTPVSIYGNTLYNNNTSGYNCITVANSSLDSNAVSIAKNNICSSTLGGAATVSSADYNDYFNAGVTCPVSGESHSICTDPKLVSPTSPSAVNFKLQGTSPAIGAGVNLTSLGITQLDTDYFGTGRPTSAPWDMGFFQSGIGQALAPSCTPTSGLVPQTVTCTNPNGGTTVMCYNTTGNPATNGVGTGCTIGTQYSTSLSISVAETLSIVAGTSTLTDSSIISYTYTTTVLSPIQIMGNVKINPSGSGLVVLQ
jgi:hypothetical protein